MFCRALKGSPLLRSIEVVLIPAKLQALTERATESFIQGLCCKETELILPLAQLRNVQSFSVRSADEREFPASDFGPMNRSSDFDTMCSTLGTSFQQLLKGNDKVECLFDMFHLVLGYAQSFQSCNPVRCDMVRTFTLSFHPLAYNLGDVYLCHMSII